MEGSQTGDTIDHDIGRGFPYPSFTVDAGINTDHRATRRAGHRQRGNAVHDVAIRWTAIGQCFLQLSHFVLRCSTPRHGQHGIEPMPAGPHGQQQAGNHADRRPDVGHQVAAITFERGRAVLFGCTQHDHAQPAVEHGADE